MNLRKTGVCFFSYGKRQFLHTYLLSLRLRECNLSEIFTFCAIRFMI